MRAIIVEDEPMTAKAIDMALRKEGFVCQCVSVADEAFEITRIDDYDVMILDIRLPGGIDGYELLLRLRSAKVRIPVMILSGLTSTEQKVQAFCFGADDYLTKPYNISELLARLLAIIRRSKGHPTSVINIGDLCVNLDSKTVECCGAVVHLTCKEYSILELLAMRSGIILGKTVFLNHLYGGMDEPELKIIDVFVCKLRKKLAKISGGDGYIETVWGRGYVLNRRDDKKGRGTYSIDSDEACDYDDDCVSDDDACDDEDYVRDESDVRARRDNRNVAMPKKSKSMTKTGRAVNTIEQNN